MNPNFSLLDFTELKSVSRGPLTFTTGIGDDFDIDSIEIDGTAKTSGDSATLTSINVNAGAITSDPLIVPLSIDALGANGELDLIIDLNAGDFTGDTVTGTAVILVRSDATCSFTTGAND